MSKPSWQVSSGHSETTTAAAEILIEGGNAFDALIAAAWTACVAEPVFCSPGGGGHALLRPAGHQPSILDCFSQTPIQKRRDKVDFYPIYGNFGTDTQEFHIGMAAAATPGIVAGMQSLHQRYGSMPMKRLAEPAVRLARAGVVLNQTQSDALAILEPIVRNNTAAARMFGLEQTDSPLPPAGTLVKNVDLANVIEQIANHGAQEFYQGEIAAQISADSYQHGGHLQAADLSQYQVHYRTPMQWSLGAWQVWSNPPPAFGGMMVALMTRSLERRLSGSASFGSNEHLQCLLEAMQESQADRKQLEQPECLRSDELLMQTYNKLNDPSRIDGVIARKGTTHISIRDSDANLAAITLSNGEGCGQVISNCGFMLNNMLGEQDLNRLGFHHWPENRRMASMMAPTLLASSSPGSEQEIMLGSGGANRIRTAIAQVICNMLHFGMSLSEAIDAPRMHLEDDELAIELDRSDWPTSAVDWLDQQQIRTIRWPNRSLYFGGVHAVSDDQAAADQRRDGSARSEV